MNNQTIGLTVYVNNHEYLGELDIERDSQVMWSDGPRRDPAWTYTDAQGHFHAYAKSDKWSEQLPTLISESVPVDCDGSCGGVCNGEGYHDAHYYCRICREEITPGTIAGPHQFEVSGPTSWMVRAKGRGAPVTRVDEKVSVRIVDRESDLFGVARVLNVSMISMGGAGEGEFELELLGEGPLGRQGKPA